MFDLIPTNQRRTVDELDDRLDLSSGDVRAKQSAFWLMLVLSSVIATAGVAADSTATVIGAMIVAPLATPILGIGLGIVTGRGRLAGKSLLYVCAGMLTVIVIGIVVAQLLPNPTAVLNNSQVVGRTSPTLMDLLAALATGLVGSIAVTRRDLGDVLPGVAIAISLVPPLAVTGVCFGSGSPSLAIGAFILFASNMVAMIITCAVVLVIAKYHGVADEGRRRRRRAYVLLAVALVVVAAPMVVNSLSAVWAKQVYDASEQWLADTPGAEVSSVTWQGDTATISVLGPEALPPLSELEKSIHDLLPWESDIEVIHEYGERLSN
ncbi:TIGR00341 family protein [Gordonia terrae]|uniref:TIGR00341 family protein n=1 Tax=Gordonia terrae TaxID=2055 RepID=UPI00200B24D9|nr:TIGR00341 family protein [Gordonia terrae]UPW07275.1 TIGR00341 family protein [Gordonia terrae]